MQHQKATCSVSQPAGHFQMLYGKIHTLALVSFFHFILGLYLCLFSVGSSNLVCLTDDRFSSCVVVTSDLTVFGCLTSSVSWACPKHWEFVHPGIATIDTSWKSYAPL